MDAPAVRILLLEDSATDVALAEAELDSDLTMPALSGEALVRVAYAGICGSDMHIIHGDNAFVRFPRITGHEFAGVVEAVGEGVSGVAVGDRVCIDPVISCGHCYPCRIGRPNVCTALEVIGVHRDGGFEERVAVPAANLHRLPEHLGLDAAALVEPYTIAANVLDRMQPHPGDRLLVFGAGVIGLTILQMARAKGIEEVIVTDVIDERLVAASELGARHVLNGRDQDVEQAVLALTDGEGVPLIADAACVPALLPPMLRLASPAGRIGLLGFNPTPSDLVQLEEHHHRIGADPEVGGVAERRQARVPQQEVQAHREHRENQRLGEQPEVIGPERERRDRQEHPHRDDRGARLHRVPNSPAGRTARIAAIGAKIVK